MNFCPSSATHGNRRRLHRNGVRRLSRASPEIEVWAQILLIIAASCIAAAAQNTASLTIQGIMPPAQRLSVGPIQTTTATNQITVTVEAKNNAAAGYEVTIQSKASKSGTNDARAAYQLTCGGRYLTLAPGTSRILSNCTGDRSTKTTLQISNPSPLHGDTLTLTVITQ